MKRVFLSSIVRGLEPYRDAVHEAINKLDDYKSIRMEDFGASDQTPLEHCIDQLSRSDIFVGIVGPKYGSIVSSTGKSFSESEYDAALASGKPMLLFLAPESFPFPSDLIESDDLRGRQVSCPRQKRRAPSQRLHVAPPAPVRLHSFEAECYASCAS